MNQTVTMKVAASQAGAVISQAEATFRQLYGHRPGFELRSGEFWPDEKLLQHQVNIAHQAPAASA